MPIEHVEDGSVNILTINVTGTLAKEDYDDFVPEFDELVREHGKLRVLFDMTGLEGWEPSAFWEEVKFDMKHFKDIERCAAVGDKMWLELLTNLSKLFTTATVRYFDHSEADEARKWLSEVELQQ